MGRLPDALGIGQRSRQIETVRMRAGAAAFAGHDGRRSPDAMSLDVAARSRNCGWWSVGSRRSSRASRSSTDHVKGPAFASFATGSSKLLQYVGLG
jgi:hypothetical protein